MRSLRFAIALLVLLAWGVPSHAQVGGPQFQVNGVRCVPTSIVNSTGAATCSGGVFTIPAGAGGTVSSVACGSGLTCAPAPIVGVGTISVTQPVPVSATAGALLVDQGAGLGYADGGVCGAAQVYHGAGGANYTCVADSTTVNDTVCTLGAACAPTAVPSGAASGDLAGTYPGPTVAKYTATGASTCSGTASFDNSGCSGIFKTPTGAVTIGTGAIGITGPVTNNIGGTTSVPWTTTGVASQNGFAYTGTAPASVAGAGTSAGSALTCAGAAGGATSGNATTGGTGEGYVFTAGAGGSGAAGTNANGGIGGSLLFTPGTGGAKSGGGAIGTKGTVTCKAPATGAAYGTVFQVQDRNGAGNFTVADSGNVATVTGGTYTAGTNVLIGSVADKLNAALMAIASQAIGDLLYADSTTTFARVAAGSTSQVLHGAAGSPTWAAVSLTADVSGQLPVGNGGTGTTAGADFNFGAYNAANLSAATAISQFITTNAATLHEARMTTDIAGVGGGNFVIKLCDDTTTCAGGHIYATCTSTCVAAAGTITSCVINLAAVAAAVTLTLSVTTACATADPGMNFNGHFTNP